MTGSRFSIEPLERLVADPTMSDAEIADRFGVGVRQLYRARSDGLSTVQADRLAVAVGLHPAVVWDWLDLEEPTHLAVRDAADVLGVSASYVRDLITAGRLPAEHDGRRYLIPTSAIHHGASIGS